MRHKFQITKSASNLSRAAMKPKSRWDYLCKSVLIWVVDISGVLDR